MSIKYLDIVDGLNTSDRFKSRIKSKVMECLEHRTELGFKEIWLFGSVARGDETYDSDIDLMLVSDEIPTREKRSLLYLYEIFDEGKADVLLRAKSTLDKPEEYFNSLIARDKIVLWKDE